MSALTYAARVKPNAAEQFGISLVPFTYTVLHYQRTFDSSASAGAGASAASARPSSGITLGTDLHYNMQDHVALMSAGIGYQFEQFFNIKAMVNTNQQIASSLEAMLGQLLSLSLSSFISLRALSFNHLLSVGTCRPWRFH